jgi:hypothetical protein
MWKNRNALVISGCVCKNFFKILSIFTLTSSFTQIRRALPNHRLTWMKTWYIILVRRWIQRRWLSLGLSIVWKPFLLLLLSRERESLLEVVISPCIYRPCWVMMNDGTRRNKNDSSKTITSFSSAGSPRRTSWTRSWSSSTSDGWCSTRLAAREAASRKSPATKQRPRHRQVGNGFTCWELKFRVGYTRLKIKKPIQRLLNSQRQRCYRLERFSKQKKIFVFTKRARLPVAL